MPAKRHSVDHRSRGNGEHAAPAPHGKTSATDDPIGSRWPDLLLRGVPEAYESQPGSHQAADHLSPGHASLGCARIHGSSRMRQPQW